MKGEVIKNVQQRYLAKLQEFTLQLKNVEKAYVQKMTDLYGKDYQNYEVPQQQL